MKKVIRPEEDQIARLVRRPQKTSEELNSVIKEVYDRVRRQGDKALKHFTRIYDGIDLAAVEVSKEELESAELEISADLKDAIKEAYQNIHKFHKAQMPEEIRVEISDHISCWQKPIPIGNVGLYIPGGSAPLFSTILMLAIPAFIAGCKNIILCTPPDSSGNIPAAVRYTAHLCGVDKVFTVGGSQAIAAMALGTESIPKVDKIFGPGNQYVTAAKMHAFQMGVGIDMPAGPSEVLVLADETADPSFVAADLLSQAEHGEDSQVVLVAFDESVMNAVETEVNRQLVSLPRKSIAKAALDNSLMVIVDDTATAFEFINEYAPEHLIIASEKPDKYLDHIINAGSVFVGNYTPESAGDYASGTNHTLPTAAAAKSFSGVNLEAFFKKVTFQRISKKGMESLGNVITRMARAESLEAHARAVEIRLSK